MNKIFEILDQLEENCDTFMSDLDEALYGTLTEGLDEETEALLEYAVRQFRRYGNTFKRQFRCVTGPKAGRLATSAVKCGMRKDPRKVRQGKRSARIKKGQRVRKTKFAKRQTPSKILVRRNQLLNSRSRRDGKQGKK